MSFQSLSHGLASDDVIQGITLWELAMYAFGRKHIDENDLLVDMLEWQCQSDGRGGLLTASLSTSPEHSKKWLKKETRDNQTGSS